VAENYKEAEHDYMLGMKYKDIAKKYGVTINTVKSWKQRYGWGKEGAKSVHTKTEKVCTQNKKYAHPPEPVGEEEKSGYGENGDMSEKHWLFCLYYVKYRNQAKAYQKAFGCSYENAYKHANSLWKKVEIQKEINRIMEEVHNEIKMDIKDLIQQQVDIARADINDFVDIIDGHVVVNENMDGTLIKEIKETKEGISVKLYDKQKAIDFLKNTQLDGSSEQMLSDTATLAEIILGSRPNRNLEDYE